MFLCSFVIEGALLDVGCGNDFEDQALLFDPVRTKGFKTARFWDDVI